MKVAASFDRALFGCAACAREEAQGGDPKGERSGTPRSCDGPRRYEFHGGAATWTGCPRLSLGDRESEWLAVYDRSGRRMTLADLAHATLLLVDVFDALDEAAAQEAAHKAATQQAAAPQQPGVLR